MAQVADKVYTEDKMKHAITVVRISKKSMEALQALGYTIIIKGNKRCKN